MYGSWKLWPILFFLLGSACSPVYAPALTPTLLPAYTKSLPPESTLTIPSPTATPRPTAAIRPMAAATATARPRTSTLAPDGPWLVYWYAIHNDSAEVYAELAVVNQAGTGRSLIKVPGCMILDGASTSIKVPGCEFDNPLSLKEDPSSRIVIFSGRIMRIQPLQAAGDLIYEEWPSLHTAFTGNTERGLLANVYPPAPDALPELRIYELPGGKIHDQFPLVKCSDQVQGCDFSAANWWEIQWSPDGRYLAFPAIWDGPSADLYLYDTENGQIQQLSNGLGLAGQIWWSPDGQSIVVRGSKSSDPYISSLWAISIHGGEPRLLYSLEAPVPQGIAGWVDNNRLIVYNGTNLFNALDLPADNLRLVDIASGQIKTLFDGSFYNAEIDWANQTISTL